MGIKTPFDDADFSAKGMLKQLRQSTLKRREAPKPGWLIGMRPDGSPVTIPYEELFSTHVEILGPTGYGKSFSTYSLVCQTILAGHGVILIDPDGPTYRMICKFIMHHNIDLERVVLINLQRSDLLPKLNPLEGPQGIDATASALMAVASDGDFAGTPRLRTFVYAACDAIQRQGLPLASLPFFLALTLDGQALREQATKDSSNPYIKLVWQDLAGLPRRDQVERLDSMRNRCSAFALDDRMAKMMTHSTGNVDWEKALRENQIVLGNLGQDSESPLRFDDVRLCGASLTSGCMHAAFRLPANRENHTFFFGEEFPAYLTEDMAQGLARLRKRHLHCVLIHQTIAQIEEESRKLWSAVENCCGIKIIFGGLSRVDAERVGKNLFTGSTDFHRIKHETVTRAFAPVLRWVDIVGHTVGGGHSHTDAESSGCSTTEGGSTASVIAGSHSQGSSSGTSFMYTMDGPMPLTPDGITNNNSTSSQSGASWSSMSGSSWSNTESYVSSSSDTVSESWARSVTHMPITEHEEFKQIVSTQFFSLEEEWERIYALLMNLPRRHVAVKVGNQPTDIVPTIAIKADPISDGELEAWEVYVINRSPYAVSAEVAGRVYVEMLESCGFGEHVAAMIDLNELYPKEPSILRAAFVEMTLPHVVAATADELPAESVITDSQAQPRLSTNQQALPDLAEKKSFFIPR